MPTIEISQEQAAALARGENVSIRAVKPVFRRFISVNTFSASTVEIIADKDGRPLATRQLLKGLQGDGFHYPSDLTSAWGAPSLFGSFTGRILPFTDRQRTILELPLLGTEFDILAARGLL